MENLLPEEIVLDIFSRIPTESILQCRLVCKTWRALLRNSSDNSNFVHMHLGRQILQRDDNAPKFHNHFDTAAAAAKVGFVSFVMIESDCESSSGKEGDDIRVEGSRILLYYGEYDDKKEQASYKTLAMLNHPSLGSNHYWVSSCNGLICLSVNHHDIYDPAYLFNPITRECCNLAPFMDLRGRKVNRGFGYDYLPEFGHIASGFGYDPYRNEYKVVRIYYGYDYDEDGRVQVYTLGSGTGWRNKGETTYKFQSSPGVYANGALHWKKGGKIVAFDLKDEKFRVLPSPPFMDERTDTSLGMLGGCVCIFHRTRGSESIHIWSFKKNKNSSYCDDSKEDEEYYKCWSWSKEFSMIIAGEGQYLNDYRPFALMKNGNVLLWFRSTILTVYDRKTATLEELVDYFEQGVELPSITHMNSLVSLKSLGEDSKIIESVVQGEYSKCKRTSTG